MSTIEVLDKFSTEQKAVKWLEKSRWGNKPVCPKCNSTEKIKIRKGHKHAYHCNSCRRKFTVKTGTVMHRSHIEIKKWAIAIYYILTARKSISSLQLSKELDVTQKTAWFMLQRIREACKQDTFKLHGDIEIDETYIGGKEDNKHTNKKLRAGRGAVGKTAVLGMRERKGRVKAMPIDNTDQNTLQTAIHDNIKAGSQLYTDDHRGYIGLDDASYQHKTVKHSAKEFVNGMAHTNGIESVWAVLKRGYNGTFHNISAKHLGKYVDEFAFRLNEGNCEIDTIDRMNTLAQNIGGKRLTYKELIN